MESKIDWNRTLRGNELRKRKSFFEKPSNEYKYGKWMGRPIIGRDTPINGGVYLGKSRREAIVVDDKKQPLLLAAYHELLKRKRLKEKLGESFKSSILTEVYELTQELLPYDKGVVNELISDLFPDQKIALEVFIKNGGGVCRHQALLAGYLLEKLKKDGLINGQVSIDRNKIRGKGAHVWVRYTNSLGEVFIIDPAQNFIGRLEDVGENQWIYNRPKPAKYKFSSLFKGK